MPSNTPFPDRRPGNITVDYRGRGSDWTLSVADDGVGMPSAATPAKAGLGTTIVESLAKQLHARVRLSEGGLGTTVSVVHAKPDELSRTAAI